MLGWHSDLPAARGYLNRCRRLLASCMICTSAYTRRHSRRRHCRTCWRIAQRLCTPDRLAKRIDLSRCMFGRANNPGPHCLRRPWYTSPRFRRYCMPGRAYCTRSCSKPHPRRNQMGNPPRWCRHCHLRSRTCHCRRIVLCRHRHSWDLSLVNLRAGTCMCLRFGPRCTLCTFHCRPNRNKRRRCNGCSNNRHPSSRFGHSLFCKRPSRHTRCWFPSNLVRRPN